MLVAIIGAASTLIVALLGALGAYWSAQRLARRQAQLERINRQLSELYGPMLAIAESGRRAYESFLAAHRNGATSFFASKPAPSEEELDIWRIWSVTVFQPGNRRLRELVMTKCDLLTGKDLPECLLMLCAHTESFEATIFRWEKNDFDLNWAGVAHPRGKLIEYARINFSALREQQARLLALTTSRRQIK